MITETANGIPFVDFGGDDEVIHFAHANGFPTESYRLLAEELTKRHRVIGMEAQPLWPNSSWKAFHTWETAADDMIRFLDERQLSGIIGAGHSFGAIATVIAANKRPDLFSKLVLVEPVILPKWIYRLSASAPYWFLKQMNPVAKKAAKRTEVWDNREMVFNQFREKKVFSKMSDEALRDYVNAGTELTKEGKAKLRYSKEWETRVYLTVSDPRKELAKLNVPFIVFRGKTSDTITSKVWQELQCLKTNGTYIEMPNCGHLLPFEKPKELAESIARFIDWGR
ncbi:MAG: alpha/beta hydrolase [Flavobacteriales bacterium]|nr:alpha/beta hydrolase [Flavobacteriales bacterium]